MTPTYPTYEEVKALVLSLLGHDRWNSGLSDERLAEKIVVTIAARSGTTLTAPGVASRTARPAETSQG